MLAQAPQAGLCIELSRAEVFVPQKYRTWSIGVSGSQWKNARLAIEHPPWPTIIDSVGCSRPTLSAPEPRLLILGSHSAPAGSHYLHRAVA